MDACLVHTQHRSPINEQWFLDQRTASQLPTPRCQCVRRNSLPGVRTPIDHRCTLACTACWLLTNVDAWSSVRCRWPPKMTSPSWTPSGLPTFREPYLVYKKSSKPHGSRLGTFLRRTFLRRVRVLCLRLL